MKEILKVVSCTKRFGGIKALDEIELKVSENKIHFIVGENGAGKSTLMKIISGVYGIDDYEGDVYYKGNKCIYKGIKDSEKDGIVIIHQELALSPHLTIYENIFLGNERRKGIFVDWKKTMEESKNIMEKVELHDNLDTLVKDLSVGKQQLVEIAKALSKKAKLLILDEPTSSLNEEDSVNLLNLLLKLKEEGVTIIMISHKMDEIMKIADELTIIRDGKTIEYVDLAEKKIDIDYIIKKMVGRELSGLYPKRESELGEDILKVKDYSIRKKGSDKYLLKDINFNVAKGEIVGFSGLVGSGRTELMLSIFAEIGGERESGEIIYEGAKKRWKSPKKAIEDGVIYVSEDRKSLGLILMQTIKNNIAYSSLGGISKYGVIDEKLEVDGCNEFKEALRIKTSSLEEKASNLSGGNQQKVVLARCFMAQPKLLIIDEPTRGIDVGAKNEIYKIMNQFVSEGNSIIMISSELSEALGMTDRIYIMNEGEIKGEIETSQATQEKIMHIALS